MPNPVTIPDLEVRFRPLPVDEEPAAQALLNDAWAVLLLVIPDLEARMASGADSADLVRFVVSAMVLRVLRNPNGVRSWTLADYSETRDNALSAGSLYVSDAEVGLLTGRASSTRSRAFSITPAQPASAAPGSESEYVEYLRSGSPFGVWPVPPGAWPA